MQTSSNFFRKSFFSNQEKDQNIHNQQTKKVTSQIISSADPFTSRDQLTPWTAINPKYNHKLKKKQLSKSSQKIREQLAQIQQDKQPQQQKVTSNLFNFYKSKLSIAKSKKQLQLKSGKTKLQQKLQQSQKQQFSLPSISNKREQEQIQKSLTQKQENKKSLEKQTKRTKLIQSINIREYLDKLKQKQKVVALSTIESPTSNFTTNRYSKKRMNDISKSIQRRKEKQNNRYENYDPYDLKVHGLQSSFQIYKQAAQLQLKNQQRKYQKQLPADKELNYLLYEKNMFKNNIRLSSLIFNDQKGPIINVSSKVMPLKKYSTISYNNRPSNLKSLHI